ncbi:hypothetical protein B0A49_03396 [Cryomyces minteri]|uniref:Uncharacterized protein n=1 Tax=Cryomyces minteri TaxID=331657 RepID=A0A4U0XKR2_9PEZI|nr:hypothetical protein B0A49_03396 [Cryomyces minteri]
MSGIQGQLLGHLVRRGVEATTSHLSQSSNSNPAEAWEDLHYQMPSRGISLMWLTIVSSLFLLASIRYTLGEVVATLAMIESPSATAYTKIEIRDPGATLEKEPLIDAEVALVKQAPITNKIRTAIKHLHRVGGFRARWRGIAVGGIYHLSHGAISNFFGAMFTNNYRSGPPRPSIMGAVGSIIAAILLSRLHMTWTHVMISEPSTKRWWRRIPALPTWKQVWLPAAVFAAAQQVTVIMPVILFHALALGDVDVAKVAADGKTKHACAIVVLKFIAVFALGAMTALCVLLPAAVTLTRIEASLLPEEEETIVPFDRTFNGKVVPTALGGTGTVGFVEAWRSFDRAARLRLIKLYVKIALIQITVAIVAMHVVALEIWGIMGDNLGVLIQAGRAQFEQDLRQAVAEKKGL